MSLKYSNDNLEYNEYFDLLKSHKWDKFMQIINSNPSIDINMSDKHNNYFLTYAVVLNNSKVTKFLVDKKAKIDITDSKNRSILYTPIRYNYHDVLLVLLQTDKDFIGVSIVDMRDNNGNVPIHYAIRFNNFDALQNLLKYNANPNVSDKNNYNSLHLAVYARNIDMCATIINHNIDINFRCSTGETALHIACNLQLYDIVKLLINKNINVNIQDYEYEYSALHYSINLNNNDIINILIKNNANLNLQDKNGNTILHFCVINQNINILQLITKTANINFNLLNILGYIPLHIVLVENSPDVKQYVDLLLENSDINIQDNDGYTCLHYLCKNNLWQHYTKFLLTKKLNIFIKNKHGKKPTDYINKEDTDVFLNLVADSYLHRLRHNNDTVWANEWENICKKELFITDISDAHKKIISPLVDNINNIKSKNDICRDIIMQQLKNNNGNKCMQSFPVKHGKICISVDNNTDLNFCTFTGTSLDVIIGLIYLLQKFSFACSTVSTNFTKNNKLCEFYKSNGNNYNSMCNFLNFEIIWSHYNLFLTDELAPNFNKCLNNPSVRFIIIPIGIELTDGSHSNYIIYDKTTKELERFEPHGSNSPYGFNYNQHLLDDLLESRFKLIVNDLIYIRPSAYLPKIGFQILESHEYDKRKIGDPKGFCAVWVIWYVSMRLTYPSINRINLVKQMLASIKSQNLSFRKVIRNYASNLIVIRDDILAKAHLDINDWINDNFTTAQYDVVINEITNAIISVNAS